MTNHIRTFTSKLAFLAGLFFTPIALADNPLPPEQATELGKLYQTYSVDNQAAITARKQAELQQTEIVTQQSRVVELQGKADRAETELGELQEFDRKKPGKVKPEEMETARGKHLQAQADVDAAQHQLEQQQSSLTQLKEVLSKKNLATENSITVYRTRFAALATEAVTRRVNGYKIAQQITESANVSCEDLPISACKTKTQQEVQRRAIEKGAIIVVDSITEIKNLTLQKDEVRSEVHGEISNLKILETRLTDEPATFFMKIQATVTPVIGDSLLEEIQRTVLSDMSLQVGDGGLAFNTHEENILAPIEVANKTDKPQEDYFSVLLKQAQAGNAKAQYEVAVISDYGYTNNMLLGIGHNNTVDWYKKSAAQGYVPAQAGLARVIQFDNGVQKDGGAINKSFADLFPKLEKLAQRGDPCAQYEMGWMFESGNGVLKNKAKSYEWYEKSAQQGYVFSQFHLGWMYHNGFGIEKNELKAFEWYEKAAMRGYAPAQDDIAHMYESGVGVIRDEAKAFAWYERSAQRGYAYAQFNLARVYINAIGVERDDAKAYEWAAKASLQGNKQVLLLLSDMCQAMKNEADAYWCNFRIARQGNVYAQEHFAEMNHDGKNLFKVKDDAEAFKWYEKAALQGSNSAQNELGKMYESGIGVAKNAAKAFNWYEKSAIQGNLIAQYHLGEMYSNGTGVSRDVTLSYAWFNFVASHLQSESTGKEFVEKERDNLKLSNSQRAEAERLSSNWKPGKPMRRVKK